MATIEELQEQIAALSARVAALTVPPNRYYSSRYTGETIDKLLTSISGGAANLDLSNLTDYQRALANLGGRPNRNLWDNGYFIGGGSQSGYGNLPINQKGKQLYDQADGNCIDRHYKSPNTTVELLSDCLKITLKSDSAPNRFAHIFSTSLISGVTYTLSFLVKSISSEVNVFVQESGGELTTPANGKISSPGIFSITFKCTKTAMYQAIFSNENRLTAELLAAVGKLEECPFQTLGWEDEGGVHIFETPSYGDMLAQCQGYLLDITPSIEYNDSYVGICGENYAAFCIPTPVSLRAVPVFIGDPSQIQIGVDYTTYPTPTDVRVVTFGKNYVHIMCSLPEGLAKAGMLCSFRSRDRSVKFLLSAEL